LILLDTSGLIATIDPTEPHHATAGRSLLRATPPLLLSPFVAAEVDYMLATRRGQTDELDFLEDVFSGAFSLELFTANDVQAALEILRRYQDLNIGLADASLVVLAQRHNATDVLTLDERHFRALRGRNGRPFRLLPADDL